MEHVTLKIPFLIFLVNVENEFKLNTNMQVREWAGVADIKEVLITAVFIQRHTQQKPEVIQQLHVKTNLW